MNSADAFYEHEFEITFLRSKGEAFQKFFERLMSFAHRGDFMACSPWGREGDRKNDGYLRSKRQLFQVYAPNVMTATKAKAKIAEDFAGAKQHWAEYFDSWVFVHNCDGGLPPHVHQLLLDLGQANPEIRIESWAFVELLVIFRELSDADKASWFGPAPPEEAKNNLGFQDIQIVIENIAAKPAPSMTEVKDVPAGKIEANALSEAAATLIKGGMIKSSLVHDFFSQWHDETLGERLAVEFQNKYKNLRQATHNPNEIFSDLQSWIGGEKRGTAEHEWAILAVMAYYFERCDIFEKPRASQ